MSNLPLQQLAADFCVAPQLEPDAMAAAAAAGFKSVINNRPDFEHGPDQPTNAQIEAAAHAAGLAYAFLPVAGSVAVGMGVDPLLLAIPATLAASCGFMFPVGTPPNAIVYGTGLVSMRERAESLGGHFTVRSGPAGTTVRAELPLTEFTGAPA